MCMQMTSAPQVPSKLPQWPEAWQRFCTSALRALSVTVCGRAMLQEEVCASSSSWYALYEALQKRNLEGVVKEKKKKAGVWIQQGSSMQSRSSVIHFYWAVGGRASSLKRLNREDKMAFVAIYFHLKLKYSKR